MDFKQNSFLAEQLKSGNEKAYRFLMESYYRHLCNYAFSLIKDHDKAEDIVQTVFIDVWFNRKNINSLYSIKNYLYKSVYNKFIDEYRKNKRMVFIEKKHLEAIDLIVEKDEKELDGLITSMNKEISNLPEKCQQIFLLNKKEGLTHTEISEYLNISIKTIEGHMTRAFKILNKKLGDQYKSILFIMFDLKLKPLKN